MISRGWALAQQFSVVKLKVSMEREMLATGLKLFPGRSPLREICAVMVSFAAGGSVRLQGNHVCESLLHVQERIPEHTEIL